MGDGDKGYERTIFRNTNTKYFINIKKMHSPSSTIKFKFKLQYKI